MALIDVQDQVDTWWSGFRTIIEFVQDSKVLEGRLVYLGANWSHTDGSTPILKNNGQGEVTPDNMSVQNQDGESNATAGVVILTPIPCSFKQDEFGDPSFGVGVYVVLKFIYDSDGLTYCRLERLRGPAVFNDTAWEVVTE